VKGRIEQEPDPGEDESVPEEEVSNARAAGGFPPLGRAELPPHEPLPQ